MALLLDNTYTTSLSKFSLFHLTDTVPNFVSVPFYMWTVTPALLSNVTLTFEWDDGYSTKQETFLLQMLLGNQKQYMLNIRMKENTDLYLTTTLIGSGEYGLNMKGPDVQST